MALTKALGGSGGGGGITELTGDVTAGPGSGSQAATIAAGAVDIAHLSATGTADATTYLRGDNTWTTPSGASLTVKDEGSTLTTAATSLDFVGDGVTATNSSGAVTVTIPGSRVAYAYWMVLVQKVQVAGSSPRIGELALRATSGGANIATGGTPIYTDQFASSGDNSAAAAFDGVTTTAWASATSTLPSGVGYQLASAQIVNEIVITARNDSFGPNAGATVFTVIASADGVNWLAQWQCTSPATWTAGLARTFTRPT